MNNVPGLRAQPADPADALGIPERQTHDYARHVECFYSVITRQAIRRGSVTSAKELTIAVGAFIDTWNDHPRPFA